VSLSVYLEIPSTDSGFIICQITVCFIHFNCWCCSSQYYLRTEIQVLVYLVKY